MKETIERDEKSETEDSEILPIPSRTKNLGVWRDFKSVGSNWAVYELSTQQRSKIFAVRAYRIRPNLWQVTASFKAKTEKWSESETAETDKLTECTQRMLELLVEKFGRYLKLNGGD